MKKNIKVFSLILLTISFISCRIGLGKAIDLEAPVLNITSPERASCVPEIMTVTGTVTDNQEINRLELNVEETNQFFKIENLNWYQKDGDNWEPYLDGTVVGNQKSWTWSIKITIPHAVSGNDYTIISQVYDMYGNESSKSKDDRVVSVDTSKPIVSVNTPSLFNTSSAAEAQFATYSLKDNSVLQHLTNGNFKVAGTQVEDTKCNYLLVYLDDKITDDIPSYESQPEFSGYLTYKRIEDKNQRNWEITFNVNDLPAEYASGKHLLRIVTESHDSADNVQRKVQGWFTFWNEADIPWVVADFGSEDSADPKKVYPSCTLQGQAYDDDGLSEICIDVYKNTGSGFEKQNDKSSVIDLSDKDNPTYYAWSVSALSDNCDFYISVKCKDINGNDSGEPIIRYMSVMDINPPSLFVESPESGSSLDFTGNGDFNFSGYVTDDGEIKALKIVRIADGKENSEINYFDSEYSEWGKATSSGYTDKNGNKVWDVTLSAETVSGNLHRREFNRTFNIYSDFGINGTTQLLTTQKLIVMAVDNGDSANIELHTYGGDTEKPVISIDDISVNGGSKKSLGETITLEPFKSGDYVELSGSWSDNSNKLTKESISLTWKGITDFGITIDYDDASKTSGTWKTKRLTPPAATTAVISAQIIDWGKNQGKANASFYISSSKPEFTRISADTPDGEYKANSKILIYMEFNKKVDFKGGTPELTLNTGKKAIYTSGRGTSKHYFTYTVGAGETTDALKVTALSTTGITWYDVTVESSTIANMALPTGVNTLEGNRTIKIDTTKPVLSDIKAITSGGYYSTGSEIFITAQYSETVNFTDVSKIKLTMNSGTSVYTSSASKSGANTVLFKYQVAEGNTAKPLTVTAINYNGCKVTDIAGNELTTTSLPATTSWPASGTNAIYIDTTNPDKPVINGLTDGAILYSNEGFEFTIQYDSDAAVNKYSLDNGKSWNDYASKVTLANNGTYTVTAYSEDKAGNVSDYADSYTVTIDKGNILTSMTAGIPDGTYIAGREIPIVLNFRKPVKVSSDSTLVLNTTPVRTAKYTSGTGTNQVTYTYTVQDNDSCSDKKLEVSGFTGSITDEKNNNIADFTKITDLKSPNRFIDNREIYVITSVPSVTGIAIGGTEAKPVLNVTFSQNINKNTGSITVTQSSTGYKAPAVISEAKYKELPTAIQAYYTEGTNGASSTGVADTLKKYILNYGTDSNNTTLTNLYITNDYLKTTIPVYSKAVTISGKVLSVDLSGAYKLPVKGASYTVSVPADLVNDDLSQANTAGSGTIVLPGVEIPYIRINKTAETINSNKTVTQPLTASVKIDCQTPGANIYYVNNSKTSNAYTFTKSGNSITAYNNNGMPGTPSQPTTSSTRYTAAFNVGNNSDTAKGYKVFLRARANATVDGKNTWSADSYETAYRTVVCIKIDPKANEYMWLRGGDAPAGGVSTPNFPLSWNKNEYSKIRAMTKSGDSNYYWVTWAINTTAYVGFISGDMPNDAATNGPKNWCWGSCAWVGMPEKTPVYAGESLVFTDMDLESGKFAFQDKHKESR